MSIYDQITDKIIDNLEKNPGNWVKAWTSSKACNYATKQAYHGVNTLLLGLAKENNGYKFNYWMTYNQASEMAICTSCNKKYLNKWENNKKVSCCDNPIANIHVKKGEKSPTFVVKMVTGYEKKDEKDQEKTIIVEYDRPIMRYFPIFNIDQIEGLIRPEIKVHEPIKEGEDIVINYKSKPPIIEGGDRACYKPSQDVINMPTKAQFSKLEEFYSTLFHELVHSTGHKNRLSRPDVVNPSHFGTEDYSKEELIAELGASFLCSDCGFINTTFNNSTAYVKNWLKVLKNDKSLIVTASAQAQKAVEYIKL